MHGTPYTYTFYDHSRPNLHVVIIDVGTRDPEVEIVRRTLAKSKNARLERVFAIHGLQNTIITENGSPFTSHDITKFIRIQNSCAQNDA